MNATLKIETSTATPVAPSLPAAGSIRPLADKAMLVTLSIKRWEGRKLDKSASAKVARDAGAKQDTARVTKSLVSKTALATIQSISTQARGIHYDRTLPWLDNGTRIISTLAFESYNAEIRKLRSEFAAAVDSFISGYDSYRDQAAIDLGDLFDPTEYPSAHEIRRRFVFDRPFFAPLPSAADFRADIGADMLADERAAMESRLTDVYTNAMRDVTARIAETVGHMARTLESYKPAGGKGIRAEGTFKDSLVENVRALVALIPSLNITNDSRIAAIAVEMAKLCEADASVLREHADVRADVQKRAAEIVASVADYF